MERMQHIALKTARLQDTRRFYAETLGLPDWRCDEDRGVLWVNLAGGFVLRFDRVAEPPDPAALVYLGLELESFAAVDERLERVGPHAPVERDLRGEYRDRQGPYGFIIRDPNGYRVKVFRYNTAHGD